jgi:acyl-coenzyme A synthetase/AMP-(fatty) acid ligase
MIPHPPPPRLNIARYCLHGTAAGDKPALIIAGDEDRARRFAFAEIERAVLALAAGLARLGLPAGERVMIRMDNDIAYVLTFFAAMAAGLVPLPSSAALTAEEAEFLLADSGARVLALSDALALDHPVPRDVIVLSERQILALAANGAGGAYADTAADDPAFLIYTSGTVGRPKGVLHGHRTAWGRRPMYAGWYGIRPDDVVLHAGAFNWTYTLGVGLIDPWANGATAVLYNGAADPAIWPRLIARHEVTIFATVPSLYRRILKYGAFPPGGFATLRHGLTAGEALPQAVREGWREATGTELYEALGMSEISTYISTGPGMAVRPGSPGKPQPGRRVAILSPEPEPPAAVELAPGETGLLAVHRSDPGLMLGYWNRPEEERLVWRGEWFCGGDLAHIDDDGYVWFHGRHDDILNPMGYRLSPLEIEGVLASHPLVHEVAVGEVEADLDLKLLVAFVVPHGAVPQADAADAAEATILAHAAAHLATYKRPRRVLFVERLPRTRNGKLIRRELPRRLARPAAPG